MPARLTSSRGLRVSILATLALAVAFGVAIRQALSPPSSPLRSCAATRRASGATGEPMRGARRYSPLDQINASNFEQAAGRLAVERRRVRPGRVLPDDAALRQRPAVHGRNHSADRRRLDPDTGETLWMWRLTKASGGRRPRGSSQDEGPHTGPTASRNASSSSRPATTWRRSTRRRASPIRSSARTASSI